MTTAERDYLRRAVSQARLAKAVRLHKRAGACLACGEPFERDTHNQRYCNRACKRDWQEGPRADGPRGGA